MRGREFLSSEQRLKIISIPINISEKELGIYYTLTENDIDFIMTKRRGSNRLGVALQLCVLRHLGCSLFSVNQVPDKVINYVGKQIKVDSYFFLEYAKREATIYEHLSELKEKFNYSTFSNIEYEKILTYLMQHAFINNDSFYLLNEALIYLRKNKIILPAVTTIESLVGISKQKSENQIFNTLTYNLTLEQKKKLDRVLKIQENSSITVLSWLRENPKNPSPDSFKKVLAKIEYLRKLDLETDLSTFHPRRLQQIARIGARYQAQAFLRLKNMNEKYAILVVYLLHLLQELTDLCIDINDRIINNLYRKGRKARDNFQKENGKAVNEKLIRFVDLTTILLEAKYSGIDLNIAIESSITWNQLEQEREQTKNLTRPIKYDYIDLLKTRFRYLKQYTPLFLEQLEFKSTAANDSLIQAISVLKKLNLSKKRKIPKDSPIDFIPKRFDDYVINGSQEIDKNFYELAVLTSLKDLIRSGDVYVSGSRKYKDLENYFITEEEWNIAKKIGTKLKVPLSGKDYIQQRTHELTNKLYWLEKNINSLDGVSYNNGEIHLEKLEKTTPVGSEDLSRKLYALVPKIRLPDLLMEVNHWTGFTENMTHASSGHKPKGAEIKVLLATIMAMGTNVGLTKMADATPEFTYKQLINTAQWRMYDDSLSRAQATLVNFHHKLSLPNYWGDGTTSSSDGMRVQVSVSSAYADYNPHFGHQKGTTLYRFVSDQYSTFGIDVIPSNAREAVFLIDRLLHHETDLEIKEHYTDTAGYTDQVFGLSHIFGFRFAPRIRSLGKAQLFSLHTPKLFPKIQSLLKKLNPDLIELNYEHILRIAHSIQEGKVAASLVMGKFGSYNRENNVVKALRTMGQIEKTLFLIDYIVDKNLRHRIQHGLNIGEAMNALARAVFFGKRGELREKALLDQYQRASALNLILNAITIWNTVYLTKAIEFLKINGETIDEELLSHVSALNWEHINFLGEYSFKSPLYLDLNSLQSLKF